MYNLKRMVIALVWMFLIPSVALAQVPGGEPEQPQSDLLRIVYIDFFTGGLAVKEVSLTEGSGDNDQNSGVATISITTGANSNYAGSQSVILQEADGTFSDSVDVTVNNGLVTADLTFTLRSDNGVGAPIAGIPETGSLQDITALMFPKAGTPPFPGLFPVAVRVQSDAVPEPGSLLCFASGLTVLAGMALRRRR